MNQLLHWDGRLDNPGIEPLGTYERWGIDGLGRLIGDWSLVIRDVATGATVLASDYAGVRPLYYHVQAGRVLWSSRLQSLVDETGIDELDHDYARSFLLYGACPNRTPSIGLPKDSKRQRSILIK